MVSSGFFISVEIKVKVFNSSNYCRSINWIASTDTSRTEVPPTEEFIPDTAKNFLCRGRLELWQLYSV